MCEFLAILVKASGVKQTYSFLCVKKMYTSFQLLNVCLAEDFNNMEDMDYFDLYFKENTAFLLLEEFEPNLLFARQFFFFY